MLTGMINNKCRTKGVFYDDKTEDFPDKFTYGTVFPCNPAFDRLKYDKYFKDRFLGWYSDNSKISEKYVDAYQKIENMDFSAGDWEQYAKAVQPYDFHLIVRDENGKEL